LEDINVTQNSKIKNIDTIKSALVDQLEYFFNKPKLGYANSWCN